MSYKKWDPCKIRLANAISQHLQYSHLLPQFLSHLSQFVRLYVSLPLTLSVLLSLFSRSKQHISFATKAHPNLQLPHYKYQAFAVSYTWNVESFPLFHISIILHSLRYPMSVAPQTLLPMLTVQCAFIHFSLSLSVPLVLWYTHEHTIHVENHVCCKKQTCTKPHTHVYMLFMH